MDTKRALNCVQCALQSISLNQCYSLHRVFSGRTDFLLREGHHLLRKGLLGMCASQCVSCQGQPQTMLLQCDSLGGLILFLS